MEKYHYIIVTETVNGKSYSYADKIKGGDNLLFLTKHRPNISGINLCSTKIEAEKIAEMWNESYKVNGTLIDFSEM